jgi:protease-4
MKRRSPGFWLLFVFLLLIVAFAGTTWLINQVMLGDAVTLASENVLTVGLSGPIVEQPGRLFGDEPVGPLALREIDEALRRAAGDARISGVVLRIGPLLTGFAKAQEIRSAIHAFRESGKPVVARIEIGSLLDLYVASAAETIVQIPSGNYLLGLVSRRQYYRDLLDTVGIEFEAFHTGPYKTAMSGYTATDMSAEEREAIESLLDSLYDQLVDGIAEDRELDSAQVRAAIDLGLVSAVEAEQLGLVDELAFDDGIAAHVGSGRRVSIREYNAATGDSWTFGRPRIALVHVDGMIVPGSAGPSPFGGGGVAGGDRIAAALRAARADSSVRAVVVRVDSPGGAVTGSDVIWREVERTAEEMPVIISMSDVAASGGYWLAMGGTRILAMPGTYTGSIGVVMARFNLAGTYDKLGVGNAIVKRGKNADIFVDSQALSEQQRGRLQASVDTTYAAFLDKVATARGLTHEDVERLAAGRVWTGQQALELGLIDEIGGLRAALSVARREAGLEAGSDVTITVYPRQPGLFEQLRGLMATAQAQAQAAPPTSLADIVRERLAWLGWLHGGGNVWALSDQSVPTAVR